MFALRSLIAVSSNLVGHKLVFEKKKKGCLSINRQDAVSRVWRTKLGQVKYADGKVFLEIHVETQAGYR